MLLSTVVKFTVMGLASCTLFKTEYVNETLLVPEYINTDDTPPANPNVTSMNKRATEN